MLELRVPGLLKDLTSNEIWTVNECLKSKVVRSSFNLLTIE